MIPKAQPRTGQGRPSAITGTSAAPARPVSSGGKHSGDALWALLRSFAEKSVAAPDEFSAQGSPSRSRRAGGGLGKPRSFSGGVATVSESGAGVIETMTAAEAIAVNPLLVSVVATLRTGSGSYSKSKGVLEVSRRKMHTHTLFVSSLIFTVVAHFVSLSWTVINSSTRLLHAVSADSGRKESIFFRLGGPALASAGVVLIPFRFFSVVAGAMSAVRRTHTSSNDYYVRSNRGRSMVHFSITGRLLVHFYF